MPKRLLNSTGAAPVPPSAPSTVMKSGVMPVSSIALHSPKNSAGLPTHNLKPTGLPLLSSRNFCTKFNRSLGEVHSGFIAGDMQSSVIGTLRMSAISCVILAFGKTPP